MNQNTIQTVAAVDVADEVGVGFMTYDEFLTIHWEFSEDGEIKTERPEYLPMIREWLDGKVWKDSQTLRGFVEKYNGVWRESFPPEIPTDNPVLSPLETGGEPGALINDWQSVKWEVLPDGTIESNSPKHLPMIRDWMKLDKESVNAVRGFIEKYGGKWNYPDLFDKR